MSNASLRDVVRNPEWLPHAFDADGRALTFVEVPRIARSELMFLFDQHFAGRFTKASFPTGAVQAEIDVAARAPIHFIFPTSFCGSSLLAKGLDIPGIAASLREPAVFTNLANEVDPNIRSNPDLLELVLRLAERPFVPGEAVVIKQSSFANQLAERMLQARSEGRAVLLYNRLETYLVALLKRGIKGRIWGRRLFTNMARWSTLKLNLQPDEIWELTDTQVASLAWLMQIQHFGSLAKAFGSRVMLLEADDLFGAPAAALHQVMTLFNLDQTLDDAEKIVTGPTFAKHSKFTSVDFDVEDRRRENEAVRDANAEEIAMVTKWLALFADYHGVSLRPSA